MNFLKNSLREELEVLKNLGQVYDFGREIGITFW